VTAKVININKKRLEKAFDNLIDAFERLNYSGFFELMEKIEKEGAPLSKAIGEIMRAPGFDGLTEQQQRRLIKETILKVRND